jgi:hypothetical protein
LQIFSSGKTQATHKMPLRVAEVPGRIGAMVRIIVSGQATLLLNP